MAVKLVLGRAGTGKTTYCMEAITQELKQRPEGPPLLMLVPEQATFQTEYHLLRTSGLPGLLRAQAISFRRLAFRVMQESGGLARVPIQEQGKQMVLYKLVHRMNSQFRWLQGAQGQHGMMERLNELLTEWKRYGLNASVIEAYRAASSADNSAALLDRKLHDLQLLAAALSGELDGRYVDADDYLEWLARGCEASQLLRGARIWVDGFHGFTPQELSALGALMRYAGQVTITLTLDRFYEPKERLDELNLFHPTARTCQQLARLAEELQAQGPQWEPPLVLQAAPPRFNRSKPLAHLEANYGQKRPLVYQEVSSSPGVRSEAMTAISLCTAANKRAEVEAIARDIRSRMQAGADSGIRWRSFMVLVRQPGGYSELIEELFTSYDIPYFLDQKEQLMHHPLVAFIRSALEVAVHGWQYEAVFGAVKTELLLPLEGALDSSSLDSSALGRAALDRAALDRLENYVLAAGIDGWRWLEEKRWKPLKQEGLDSEASELTGLQASTGEGDSVFHEVLAARRAVVEPLEHFRQELAKSGNVRQMCEAVYGLLLRVDAPERLEVWSEEDQRRGELRRSRVHQQLWTAVLALLDQLVELMGEETLEPALFAGMLETGLEGLRLASIPPSLDEVLVGSMDRTRATEVDVCYVLGANDGLLPMRVQEDGILSESEREWLAGEGLPMAPGARRRLLDERFLIYNALAAARMHVWISCALADEEGKSLYRSELFRQIQQLFPEAAQRQIAAAPEWQDAYEEQLAFISHPAQTLSLLIARLRAALQGEPLSELWEAVFAWFCQRPEWRGRLQQLAASLVYRNEAHALSRSTALQLYGERLRTSVSRMERFVACPFQHYATYGLRLRERRLFQLTPPDIGQLYHAALSQLAASLGDEWGKLPQAQLRLKAAETMARLAPQLQSEILLSSRRMQYVARKLEAIIAQAALVLGEHARRAEFRPVGLEVGFGPGEQLPSLLLPLEGARKLEVVGRIDRVDAAYTDEGLLLRVLDYKSSATSLKLDEVLHGMSLQMITYLDVLLTHAEQWLGHKARPAGVLYFHVHNPLLAVSNALSEDQIRQELMKRFKLKGLLLAEESTIRKMDNELSTGHSELLPAAIKKDGSFYSSSAVADLAQWGKLRKRVRGTIQRIGKRITAGEVAISPYRIGERTPCTHCAYRPVCQFDTLIEGNAYARLERLSREKVWEQLAASDDGPDAGSGQALDEGGEEA